MLRWIVGFVCLLACSRPLAADEQAVNVFDRVEGSVVELRNALGSGTGIVLNREGLILTNAHVIASQLHFRCLASLEQNGVRKTYVYQKVQVLGVHSQKDLAVVKIDPAEHPVVLPPVRISAVKARPGQQVFAIGNPGGKGVSLTKTITAGLVSGVDRAIEGVMYYQISADQRRQFRGAVNRRGGNGLGTGDAQNERCGEHRLCHPALRSRPGGNRAARQATGGQGQGGEADRIRQ